MELSDYAKAVFRGWWIVLTTVAIGVAVGVTLTVVTQPVYQSTVKFFVAAPTTTQLSALEADALVRGRIVSYASLLTSERFVRQIMAVSGNELTEQQVAKSISAYGDPDTLMLTVDVKDVDANRAQAVATAISTRFGNLVNELESGPKTSSPEAVLNVVSGPTLAPAPVAPRKSLNLGLGLLLGLALGIAIAIARQHADKTIRSAKQLDVVPPLPVLASMPADRAAKGPDLMIGPQHNSPLIEAARGLRTNIQFYPDADLLRLIAVTSADTGSGKTTTALCLARAFSEAKNRVLVLEADLRNPQLAVQLGLDAEPGLAEVLNGEYDALAAIQHTVSRNLDVLVAGATPEHPSEMLGSGIDEVLAELRHLYDLIVIDTTALSPWTDSAVVAAAAEGTIVVAGYGKTTQDELTTGLQSLASVHARVLGTVLTRVPTKGAGMGRFHPKFEPNRPTDSGAVTRKMEPQQSANQPRDTSDQGVEVGPIVSSGDTVAARSDSRGQTQTDV